MNTILPFDTETTGIPDWKAPSEDPSQPHLVQLAAHVVDVDNKKIIQTMDVIIKPDGWVIEPELTAIHGITQEMAMDIGIGEKLALSMFVDLWALRPRIAFNTTFDNRIIRIALKRYFGTDLVDKWHNGSQGEEWKCMMLAARKAMGGKQPTLQEAYKHFTGRDMEGAHSAIGDANACLELYWYLN